MNALRLNKKTMILCMTVLLVFLLHQISLGVSFNKKKQRHKENYISPWSLQVAFDDDVTNGRSHGIRFSLKKNYDRYSAFRLNLGLTGQDVEYTSGEVYYYDGSGVVYDRINDFDINGGYLSLQYMHHPGTRSGLDFFWGIGPRLSVREPEFDYAVIYDNGYFIDIDRENSTYLGLGLEGTLGLEWFLGRHFSLLAEYTMVWQNEWLMYQVDYYSAYGAVIEEVGSIDEGGSFDGNRIKLGMALYF